MSAVKILLDTCVWGGGRAELEALGHDVVWTGEWAKDPGDAEILATAHAQRRVRTTLDKDFGEHAIVYRTPHSGIVRLVGFAARKQARVCAHVLEQHGEALLKGAIVTAEPGRIRIRPPE